MVSRTFVTLYIRMCMYVLLQHVAAGGEWDSAMISMQFRAKDFTCANSSTPLCSLVDELKSKVEELEPLKEEVADLKAQMEHVMKTIAVITPPPSSPPPPSRLCTSTSAGGSGGLEKSTAASPSNFVCGVFGKTGTSTTGEYCEGHNDNLQNMRVRFCDGSMSTCSGKYCSGATSTSTGSTGDEYGGTNYKNGKPWSITTTADDPFVEAKVVLNGNFARQLKLKTRSGVWSESSVNALSSAVSTQSLDLGRGLVGFTLRVGCIMDAIQFKYVC